MAAEEKIKLFTKDFLLITLMNFVLFTSFQFFPSTLPLYAKNVLGVSDGLLGLITASLNLAAIIARPFVGVMSDKYGRKGLMIAGVVLIFVCTFALAFCPYFALLLVVRFVHGIGWSCATTTVNTVASDLIPKPLFARGMSYYTLSIAVGLAIGPALGLALFNALGMRALVLISCILIGLLIVLAIKFPYPEFEGTEEGKREKLIERRALVPTFVSACWSFSFGTITTFLALYAQSRGVEQISWFFVCLALSCLLTRVYFPFMTNKLSLCHVAMIGAAILIVALLVLVSAKTLGAFLVVGVIFGAGHGILQSSLQPMAILRSPANRKGAANATYLIGFDLGMCLGATLAGVLIEWIGYSIMYGCMALLPLIGFFVLLVDNKREQAKAAAGDTED